MMERETMGYILLGIFFLIMMGIPLSALWQIIQDNKELKESKKK